MLILFVPLEIVVEELLRSLLSKSPLFQSFLFGFGAELNEATELDAGILCSTSRLRCCVEELLKQCLGGSVAGSAPVHATGGPS